jgi:hypothetical protein
MTFSDGGRSTGEDDAVFIIMDRKSDVSGSTESGGVFGILIGDLKISDAWGDEKESRVVGSTGAYVAWRSNGCDERLRECKVKKDVLELSFTCLIGPAILRSEQWIQVLARNKYYNELGILRSSNLIRTQWSYIYRSYTKISTSPEMLGIECSL